MLQRRAAAAGRVFRGRAVSDLVVRNGVVIDDGFAEAFPMKATRLVITAHNATWARHAAVAATGFATSVIACGCEAGIERELAPGETPDGRPGIAVLLFSMSGKELAKQIERRVGQCVLTCPTTAIYAGIEPGPPAAEYGGRPPEGAPPGLGRPGAGQGEAVALGKNLRFFGDGWQTSKMIAGVRYWRVPVMDGEFVAQETTAVVKGVGGGNLLLLARDTDAALAVAEAAVAAMQRLPNVIMPFPGGVVRSGSKVGSKYAALSASTNDAFCPSLYGLVAKSELTPQTRCVMEIVIDGLTEGDVAAAMRAGIEAGVALGAAGGLLRISAGNYGGKLGPFHFHLHKLQGGGAA
jgi:formylmethanofuran--tetrahydromethanopterin N-formyltransferase